jgi:UDP-N-acetylmuramate--alanine ligase
VSTLFLPGSRVHVIGCGGAGMSGLARFFLERGCVVSGSDAAASAVTRALEDAGVRVVIGHDARHVVGADVVIASPAVGIDNVERVAAVALGIPFVDRAHVLAQLASEMNCVGLTGTHGKTTATSMMACVLSSAQRQPSWLLGAPIAGLGENGHRGDGDTLVLEVDESFGSFSLLTPSSLGVLNIEPDHLDFYGTVDRLESGFAELMERTLGDVVVWFDDVGVVRTLESVSRAVHTVGRSGAADFVVSDEAFTRSSTHFTLTWDGGSVNVELNVPGALNVANGALVAALALRIGVDPSVVVHGLSAFRGAPRRFERMGQWRNIDVIDDYAHLPTEVSATIGAARTLGYEHITAVFEPHRVTRTTHLGQQFEHAFDGVDSLIVTDIYTAGEENPDAITGNVIVNTVRGASTRVQCYYEPTLGNVVQRLNNLVHTTDLILVMGAGGVFQLAQKLVEGYSP